MAQTTGSVNYLRIGGDQVCTIINNNPSDAELFVINISSSDDSALIAYKTCMIDLLTSSHVFHLKVSVEHGDQDGIISQVVINPA